MSSIFKCQINRSKQDKKALKIIMSSFNDTIKLLKEKLDDLQRDTQFCVNNYDYHHKNNEYEIIQDLHCILKDSLVDGQEFLSYMENIRSSIETARRKCSDIDVLLVDLGVDTEISEESDNYPTGSRSFHEEQESGKGSLYVLEENKENIY
ncbi:hypothetical protein CVS40_2454 [Lucilia cuprina]|nr:hypothetical protein CVS40_2454 [Lucilia cuprina]